MAYTIIDWREQMFRKRLMSRRNLEEFDVEIRLMYFRIAAELLNPTLPALSNTDGDPLALTTLTYELRSTVNDAVERLAPLARVHGDDHVDEITRDGTGAIVSAVLSWVKSGNRQNKDWDNTVLGTLRLSAGRLVADVNSARRAGRLKREIVKCLGSSASLIETVAVDPVEAVAERQRQRAAGTLDDELPLETPPELKALEKELRRRHWEQWLTTRVPALGNKTPRQAARSAGGRERLEALLAQFERNAERGDDASADLEFIRAELGVTKRA